MADLINRDKNTGMAVYLSVAGNGYDIDYFRDWPKSKEEETGIEVIGHVAKEGSKWIAQHGAKRYEGKNRKAAVMALVFDRCPNYDPIR